MTNQEDTVDNTTVDTSNIAYVPVTWDRCDHIEGPFYHGTKYEVKVGGLLVPGHGSNYQEGRTSTNKKFPGK